MPDVLNKSENTEVLFGSSDAFTVLARMMYHMTV
jgi:hypothetical protein